jgi:hypothetical protein
MTICVERIPVSAMSSLTLIAWASFRLLDEPAHRGRIKDAVAPKLLRRQQLGEVARRIVRRDRRGFGGPVGLLRPFEH